MRWEIDQRTAEGANEHPIYIERDTPAPQFGVSHQLILGQYPKAGLVEKLRI